MVYHCWVQEGAETPSEVVAYIGQTSNFSCAEFNGNEVEQRTYSRSLTLALAHENFGV
jgi:hypothetical protein